MHPSDGRVFIAYDPQDSLEASGLCARLEQAGFAVWLAGRDSAGGTAEQAYAAVRSAAARSACLLLILSGRPVNMAMLGDLTQLADSAGRPIIPVRVGQQAQVPDFPPLARARAWIDGCGPAAEQEFARLASELSALAPRVAPPPPAPAPQPQWSPPAAPPQPQSSPAAAPPPAQPVQHYPATHPAPPSAAGHGDWNSVEVQPGETSLGTWVVGLRGNGPDITGTLTVTDRRILFKPKVAGTSLVGMLLSQRKSFKDRHTIVLPRDRVIDVQTKKSVIGTWVMVTTAEGGVCAFHRSPMSADPILAALQPR